MSQYPTDPLVRPATTADIPAIRALLAGALASGELPGTSLRDVDHLLDRLALDRGRRLVSLAGDVVAGFFDPDYPLLAVDPRFRRRRHGTRLVEHALAAAREASLTEIELAPPLGSGVAEAFATILGFSYRSSLWQLRLAPTVAVEPPEFPAGYELRAFQPGPDDEAYLELMNSSFVDHPTPMDLTLDQMRLAHSRPGFDPSDIAIVTPPGQPEQFVGFCRTMLATGADDSVSEIVALAVLPGWRRLGLGRALLRWGIHHLRAAGAGDVYLNVEGRNDRALALYEQTGFVRQQEWPRWVRPVSGPLVAA